MPPCGHCPDGPSIWGQASLERRPGDTDVAALPQPSHPDWHGGHNPLTDVLDWLGRSDFRDHSTFTPLPTIDPADYAQANRDARAAGGAPGSAPAATASPAPLPRLQPRTLQKALAVAEPDASGSVQQAVNGSGHICPRGDSPPRATNSSAWIPAPSKPSARHDSLRGGSAGALCLAGPACLAGDHPPEHQMTQEEEEEDEWAQRQQRTGTVGRLVQYQETEKPKDDLLLRGGSGRHVVVAAVRDGGPASKVGVKAGDRLVSVDGSKDFLRLPADTIREQLTSPTVLVFLGFVGKLQAEVRLSCSDRLCGLTAQQSALAKSATAPAPSRFTICEERVFKANGASIFLTAEPFGKGRHGVGKPSLGPAPRDEERVGPEGKYVDEEEDEPTPSLFELQRGEAHGILRRALEGPPCESPPIGCFITGQPAHRPPPLGMLPNESSTPVGGLLDHGNVAVRSAKGDSSPGALSPKSAAGGPEGGHAEDDAAKPWFTPQKAPAPRSASGSFGAFDSSPHGPSLFSGPSPNPEEGGNPFANIREPTSPLSFAGGSARLGVSSSQLKPKVLGGSSWEAEDAPSMSAATPKPLAEDVVAQQAAAAERAADVAFADPVLSKVLLAESSVLMDRRECTHEKPCASEVSISDSN